MYHIVSGVSSVRRHKTRNILNMLGVIFGTAALIAMLAVGESTKREFARQIGNLGADTVILRGITPEHSGSVPPETVNARPLFWQDVVDIRNSLPAPVFISCVQEIKINNIFSQGHKADLIATDSEYFNLRRLEIQSGRKLCDLDIERREQVCVLGSDLAADLGGSGCPGETLILGAESFMIVGILESRREQSHESSVVAMRDTDRMLIIPLGSYSGAMVSRSSGELLLDEVFIRTPGTASPLTAAMIGRMYDQQEAPPSAFKIIVPRELLAQSQRTVIIFNAMLGALAIIALLVGGIGIMNTIMATVFERTREIGIRRAVGAGRVDILCQFLSEAVLLTVTGGAAGVLSGVLLAWTLSFWLKFGTVVTWLSIVLAMVLSLITGLLAGLYPAFKACSIKPVEALQCE